MAILKSDTASVRHVPDNCTSASCAPCTANLFGGANPILLTVLGCGDQPVLNDSFRS
jgi:hypothetical protein